jgi:hypothetical protein
MRLESRCLRCVPLAASKLRRLATSAGSLSRSQPKPSEVQFSVLTYSYLVSWILGGLVLVTIVFMRPQLRPYWLALALMGFGATGFVTLGLGVPALPLTLVYAALAGLLGGGLGFGIERIGPRGPPAQAP